MPQNLYTPKTDFMDMLLDAVCVVDLEGRFVFISAACERIFGYTQEEMISKNVFDLVHPEDLERTRQSAKEVANGAIIPYFENRYIRKDGTVVHLMWSARWSEADKMRVAVARDVSQLKRAESMEKALYAISEAACLAQNMAALYREIHHIVSQLLHAQSFFVAFYDKKKDELSFPYYVDEFDDGQPAVRRLSSGGLSAEVIRSGKALLRTIENQALVPGIDDKYFGKEPLDWLGVPLKAKNKIFGVLVVQNYSDNLRYREQDKELLQFVSTQIASAIERKQLHTRLQYTAEHDALTELPNRLLFRDRLKTALARARRNRTGLAVLFLDLDRFKQINDSYGHLIGDLLLQQVAQRIRKCVRESDTVGRLGGDEFVVLLDNMEVPEFASLVAEKIRTVLLQRFEINGNSLAISPSIGVALFPEHGRNETQLLRYADEDMYRIKKSMAKGK